MLGEGPLRAEMEEFIRQNGLTDEFVLLGAKINPFPYLKDCNIYVQTSKFEGYGRTVAEARMFNKPIVSTNFDVVHEQIENGKNGFIVEMNSEAVCNGILTLIENETLAKSIVERLKTEKKGNSEELEKWHNLLGAEFRKNVK